MWCGLSAHGGGKVTNGTVPQNGFHAVIYSILPNAA